MKIRISGKNLDVGGALHEHVEETLQRIVGKYFQNTIETSVVISRAARQFRSDVEVHVGRGIQVRAHGESDDAYAAFDLSAAHLEKRLRRHKRRLRDHHATREESAALPAQKYVIAPPPPVDGEDEKAADGGAARNDDQPVIIAEMGARIEHLSVSEAVMRMDLEDLPALLFHNASNGKLNMVYVRRDQNIGWIDPGKAE